MGYVPCECHVSAVKGASEQVYHDSGIAKNHCPGSSDPRNSQAWGRHGSPAPGGLAWGVGAPQAQRAEGTPGAGSALGLVHDRMLPDHSLEMGKHWSFI